MRTRGRLPVVVGCAVMLGGGAALARAPVISIGVSAPTVAGYRAIDYTRAFSLTGRLASRRRGMRLALEASAFPFTARFRVIGEASTSATGAFAFRTRLQRATRYRVVAIGQPGLASSVVTVYALSHAVRFSCNLCSRYQPRVPLRVTYDYEVPDALVADHAARPAYIYLGTAPGRAVTRLSLREVVRQRLIARGRVGLDYSLPLTAPAARVWTWRTRVCWRDREASDGFGLPGRHGCGDRTILANAYLG